MIELLAAQVSLTTIGYVFAATVLTILGVILIAFTSEIPFLNILTTAVGWTLIVLGGVVGLYGIVPQTALYISIAIFAIIYIVGMGLIVYHEWTKLRKL